MKNNMKGNDRTLVKTTMVALCITALLLIGSVHAAPFVTQPSHTLSIQELHEHYAHASVSPQGLSSSTGAADGMFADDVGVVSIDAPESGMATGAVTPKATVENFGTTDLVDVPVQFQIGYTVAAPGGYFFNFESDNGGWVPTASWAPYIGDFEWTNTYDVSNYVYGAYPTSEKPPLAAYSGTGLWGTIIYAPYTNANGFSYLSQTFNFSQLTAPSISWRSWEQTFGDWDYCQLRVNGNLVWGPSWDYQNPEWRLREVDLSSYSGLSSVEIKFEMFATSVVNYAGWYIDDILIGEKMIVSEYDQTVLVDLDVGESIQVEFPTWLPAAWHNQEDITIPYDIWVKTNLSSDVNPANDLLTALVGIHYGFYHDVAVDAIIAPVTGYATVITPEATVSNIGQYDEASVTTTMVIEKKEVIGTAEDFEATNGGYIASGGTVWEWGTPTSGPGAAHSGVKLWATVLAGNYPQCHVYLDTPTVTLPAGSPYISFWHWYDTEASYDGGNVKISTDNGATWTLITPLGGYTGTGNTANPLNGQPIFTGHNQKYWEFEEVDLASYAGQSVMFRFEFGADSSVFYPGWYIDDVTVGINNWVTEYNQSTIHTLVVGESSDVTFPDWTPSDITRTTIDYRAFCTATITGDGDLTNNQLINLFSLTYIHDTGVIEITEPTYPYLRDEGDIIFHQRPFTPTESWTFRTSAAGAGYVCQDDFWALTESIGDIEFWGLTLIYSAGWTQGNPAGMEFEIIFYENGGTAPGAPVETFSGLQATAVNTGLTYSGFTMFYWALDLPEDVDLADGWVSIQSTACPDGSWLLWAGSPEGNLNMWQQGGSPPQIAGDSAFNLSAGAGGPGGNWPPGTYGVAGVAKNFGSFTETNVVVNAKIWKQDTKDILFYEENVTLPTLAAGAEAPVVFPDVTFQDADEGFFKLEMRTMLPNDDVPGNDMKTFNFVIQAPDVTPPVTTHELTGTMGENDWYVSCVTVTLTAVDPPAGFIRGGGKWPTGVNVTYYKVDEGNWEEYTVPFIVTDDGEHTVSYYSEDNAGNVETTKTVDFKIDTTAPTITLTATAQNPLKTKWLLEATVSDANSGVVKVEFYIDDAYVGEATSAPWEYLYQGKGKVAQAIVYDAAGNSAISDPVDSLGITELILNQATTLTAMHTTLQ